MFCFQKYPVIFGTCVVFRTLHGIVGKTTLIYLFLNGSDSNTTTHPLLARAAAPSVRIHNAWHQVEVIHG